MPRELTACEIDSIMVGATFLGAGGGGPLDTGRELLKKQTSGSYSIDLYSMDEIPEKERDATYGAMVACLGSPQKIKENGTFGPDGVACFDAFKKAMLLHGKEIKYLYSGEMGGMNTMVPMLVSIIAKQQGGSSIGLLDFDANGTQHQSECRSRLRSESCRAGCAAYRWREILHRVYYRVRNRHRI